MDKGCDGVSIKFMLKWLIFELESTDVGTRSMVAKGQARDGAGGFAPMAARMKKMIYDCAVEESAMRHTLKCRWGHSAQHERPGLGESLYAHSLRQDKIVAATEACRLWFDELAKYGVGQANVLTQELWNIKGVQIGHYTQV
ncbi:hypothetical protein ANCCEY_08968 [Ancylostoma ceylanicum]|uniref:SCP domain-containing protein n=1 Tax=Ancylostoma ceylanicum TaxID=53326 RepID=A0A0D6LPK5_9BILA|nr:hypothetical protein ANCCEY_08968 [Ancylostoma ceylanicum]